MNKKASIFKRTFVFGFLIILLFPVDINSQEMPVPVNLQAALFKKIFTFDKTLQSKSVEVAILSADGSATEVVNSFKEAGINVKVVNGNSIPEGATIIYVMPGIESPKQQSAQKKVLSISGVTSFVESGKVAVGLGVEGGKPKIIVNMAQLKAEGHELSADLLKIAKVIQ